MESSPSNKKRVVVNAIPRINKDCSPRWGLVKDRYDSKIERERGVDFALQHPRIQDVFHLVWVNSCSSQRPLRAFSEIPDAVSAHEMRAKARDKAWARSWRKHEEMQKMKMTAYG